MQVIFIIDSIETFNTDTDSTYMMMRAAQQKGWKQYIANGNDIWLENGKVFGKLYQLYLTDDSQQWFFLDDCKVSHLENFDCIFIRKNPPFNMDYLYLTYILESLEDKGMLIVNSPKALRDYNEKFSITKYLKFIPDTLVTCNIGIIKDFLQSYKDIIIKPLDKMGGDSIFRVKTHDLNKNVIIETMTSHGNNFVMVQEYQNFIKTSGDKRILIVNGNPVNYLAARTPTEGDIRGNISKGATVQVRHLNNIEYKIAHDVGSELKVNGVIFAGVDIIGEKLIEINITSPTMVQEIYRSSGIDASLMLINSVENILRQR